MYGPWWYEQDYNSAYHIISSGMQESSRRFDFASVATLFDSYEYYFIYFQLFISYFVGP